MNILHALLFGLTEGVTEFLPVSANAHIIILGSLLKDNPELTRSFGVALQGAPALAVLFLYWNRFEALFRPGRTGLDQGTGFQGARAWQLMALVTVPVLVCGLLFKKYFYSQMLGPLPSVAGLALGGAAILGVEFRPKVVTSASVDAVTLLQALGVGLFQCLALWPGVSRSGATIIGALLLGLNRKTAAEFSFLAGVPVLLAASLLELHKSEAVRAFPLAFGLAFATAFVLALLSVSQFMRLLSRISFKPFGWYRLALSPLLWFFFQS
ncbi:MAG TPA: undecaprenyl-diphosphate phosphatase [bacterium]|jgi:undecaprenyl-diphosphatase|nr:undecaprenyl-diphosphate phosphatase [bacterium]